MKFIALTIIAIPALVALTLYGVATIIVKAGDAGVYNIREYE